MSEIAISLSNISKCYKRYDKPVDRLKELAFPSKVRVNEFWALHDINLTVGKGQTLGVVGRNGSGKSTLLQIIAGTLSPTSGQVKVNGRISALLELGSGFNPEFTGRQNVFFNGRLLGLSQQELEEKYEEIVAFADIGSFIDQPVRTYSSGMFVRLAFAVAINVNPDVFIVDEALAVGDEAFQRKCFARIQAIQDRGGTILFVSHAAASVVKLCSSAVLLDQGELLLESTPKLVISQYQKLIYAPSPKVEGIREEVRALNQQLNHSSLVPDVINDINCSDQADIKSASTNNKEKFDEFYDPNLIPSSTFTYVSSGVTLSGFHIKTLKGKLVNHLLGRNEYVYAYSAFFSKDAYDVKFGMLIKTINGIEVAGASYPENAVSCVRAGTTVEVQFRFKCLFLPGTYFLNAGVVGGIGNDEFTYLARHIDVAMFRVQPEKISYGTGFIDLLIEPDINVELASIHQERKQEEKQFDFLPNSL
jgi:lipopolysaccharide transport system ATP-binding protein